MSNGEGGRIQGRGKEGTDDDNKDDDKDDDDDDDDDDGDHVYRYTRGMHPLPPMNRLWTTIAAAR